MHPEQIKAAIRMKGTTPSAIADDLEISRTTVSHVIRGTGTSERVAQRIAEVTGLSLKELWPGKYTKKLTKAQERAAFKSIFGGKRK